MASNPLGFLNFIAPIANAAGGLYNDVSAVGLMNDLITYRNNLGNSIQGYLQNNLPAQGYVPSLNTAAAQMMFGIGNSLNPYGLGGQYNDQIGQYLSQLNGYGQNTLPGLTQPGNPTSNPFFSNYYMPNMDMMNGSLSNGTDAALQTYFNNGNTPYSQAIYNLATQNAQGNNPYMQTGGNIGNYLLNSAGQNPTNNAATDMSLYNMSQNGWNPQFQEMFNTGGNVAGLGGSIVQNGGANPFLSNVASTGINGLNSFSSADPASFMGQTGNQVLSSLFSSPYVQQGFNTANNIAGQATGNFGYSPQDQTMFNYALPAFAQGISNNGNQIGQAFNSALNTSNQDVNSLPDWFSKLSSSMPGLNGQAINLPQVSGGNFMAASAPTSSKDIGPDARKALDLFYQNPLLSNEYAMDMADNAARTAGIQQAQQAAAQAKALGGPGALVANGAGNQAIKQMADQIMQNRAGAQTTALMNQQTLANNRANTAASLGQGLASMIMNANIADANNATQASTANASASAAVNGQNVQAQIANSQNALALAQLLSGNYQAVLNNATSLRGQNVQSQGNGLNSLSSILNSANGQNSLLSGLLQSSGQNAASNYGVGGSVANGLPSFANAYTGQLTGVLNPLVSSQNTGTQRAGLYGDILNNASNNMTGQAGVGANVLNTGVNAMGTAGGLANTSFGNNSGLYGTAAGNQLGLMTLGSNLNNNYVNSMFNWANLGQKNVDSANQYGIGSGNLANSFLNSQGGLFNNTSNFYNTLAQQDLSNRTGAAGMFNNYYGNMNAAFNPIGSGISMAQAPFQNVYDQTMGYLGGTQNLYNQLMQMYQLPSGPRVGGGGG